MIAGQLELQLMSDVARIKADMDKASGIVSTGAKAMQGALDSVGRALSGLAVGLSAAALGGWIKSAINAADETHKLSQRIGIAASDVAGLQLAYKQAGLGQDTMATSLARLSKGIVEGNVAFSALGIKTKETSGALKSQTQVLYEVADRFKQMPDGVQKAAIAMELFGKSGAEMIPLLNGGSEGMREMAEMAAKLGLTIDDKTAKQAEQFNDTLELIGLGSQGVARGIAAQLLPTLTNLASSFLTSMTEGDKLKRTADFLGAALKLLYSVALGVVEAFNTVGKVLGGVTGMIVAALRGDFAEARGIFTAMKSDIGRSWADTAGMIKKAWAEEGDAAVAAAARSLGAGRNLLADAKAREEGAKKAGDAARKAAEDYDRFIAKLTGKEAGVDPDFLKKMNDLIEIGRQRGKIEAQIRHEQELYIAQQPYMLEREKELTEHVKERRKEFLRLHDEGEKMLKDLQKSEDDLAARMQAADDDAEGAILKRIVDLKREVETHGMLESQIASVTLARMIDARNAASNNMENIDGIDRQIAAQERLIEAIKGKEAKDATVKAAKEHESMWESIDKTAHDVFVNIFEDGAGTFKRLGQTLKASVLDLLYQMTVKRWIISISASMGVPGAAQAGNALTGNGGMMNLLSSGGMLGKAGGFVTGIGSELMSGTLLGNIGAGMAGVGGSFASSVGAGLATDAMGATVIEGAAAATLGSGSAIGAGLAAIGPVGWIALAALAAYAIFSKKGGAPKSNGVGGGFLPLDVRDGGTYDTRASGIAGGIKAQYEAIVSSLGGRGGVEFGIGMSVDPKGTAPSFVEAIAARNGTAFAQSVNLDVGRTPEALQEALTKQGAFVLAKALADSDLPAIYTKYLHGVTEQASAADITTAVNSMQTLFAAIRSVDNIAEMLPAIANLRDISDEATDALLTMSGGLESLTAGLNAYYTQFFTAEEQRANTIKNMQKALTAAGLSVSESQIANGTREQFRGLVDSLDLTSEFGRRAFTTLMSVAGAFAELHPVVEVTATAVDEVTESVKEVAAAAREVFDATGQIEAGLRARVGEAEGVLQRAYEREAAALQEKINGEGEMAKKLSALRRSLFMGDLAPVTLRERAAAAERSFQDTLERAIGGDAEARDALDETSKTYLLSVNETARTREEQIRAFIRVQEGLRLTANVAAANASVAQLQLDALQHQVAPFLPQINASVLSVRDAIERLQGALAVAAAAGVRVTPGAGGGAGGATPEQIRDFISQNAGDPGAILFGADRFDVSLADIVGAGYTPAEVNAWLNEYGISPSAFPGHAGGLIYVPHDNYMFRAHQGEAVLARDEANAWRAGGSGEVAAELRVVRSQLADLQNRARETAENTRGTKNVLTAVTRGGESMVTTAG